MFVVGRLAKKGLEDEIEKAKLQVLPLLPSPNSGLIPPVAPTSDDSLGSRYFPNPLPQELLPTDPTYALGSTVEVKLNKTGRRISDLDVPDIEQGKGLVETVNNSNDIN